MSITKDDIEKLKKIQGELSTSINNHKLELEGVQKKTKEAKKELKEDLLCVDNTEVELGNLKKKKTSLTKSVAKLEDRLSEKTKKIVELELSIDELVKNIEAGNEEIKANKEFAEQQLFEVNSKIEKSKQSLLKKLEQAKKLLS